MSDKRLIVAMTGATGSILGVRLLELLQDSDIETHLVMSKWAARTVIHETPYTTKQIKEMVFQQHSLENQGSAISSGSFLSMGMVVLPCSVRTLSAIATGEGHNLIHRAADVVLKERRKLVLAVRESPLNPIHLENMLKLSRLGVSIVPPMPAFYNHPQTITTLVDHMVMRILDQLGIHLEISERWVGEMAIGKQKE